MTVIESYSQRGWYFIAVRIALGNGKLKSRQKASLERKLAAGELHPLHITFPTAKCVFPLKISAVNGKPSEVSLYVISKEPEVSQLPPAEPEA